MTDSQLDILQHLLRIYNGNFYLGLNQNIIDICDDIDDYLDDYSEEYDY